MMIGLLELLLTWGLGFFIGWQSKDNHCPKCKLQNEKKELKKKIINAKERIKEIDKD